MNIFFDTEFTTLLKKLI